MRLIDADKFKQEISGMAVINGYPAEKVNACCELIDIQPTAYDVDDGKLDECVKCAQEHEQLVEWLTQLKEYQQLEEQGRLFKLPCKVGDTVWDNDYGRPYAYTITAFSFGECEGYICESVTTKEVVFYYANLNGSITGSFAESEIGKSVFLNKSEAEAKLKELRGSNEQKKNNT